MDCARAAPCSSWRRSCWRVQADGFIGLFQDRRHYAKWEFVNDDVVLDPERPEFLMYYASPDGMQLIGFMFYI